MYKEDLELNNLQYLICNKIQPKNQTTWVQSQVESYQRL